MHYKRRIPNIFKQELKNFLKLFLEFKPEKLLWDNRNFNFVISNELNQWIEKDILIPQYKNGLKKLAFIVTKDIYIQQTIIKSIESFKPYIKPHFFLTELEGISFLNETHFESIKNNEISNLQIEELPNQNYEIKINLHKDNIEDTIIAIKEIKLFQEYRKKQQKVYNTLTLQEKIIIRQIVYGKTNMQIANSLFIQNDTIKTHRKNLKRKIQYQSNFDLLYFAKAFNIISF